LKHLEFHFIELKKFNKTLDEVATIFDKWIYVLKYADTLQEIPASFDDPVLKDAFGILAQSNWSKRELEAYDRYLDSIRSAASQLETAEEIGMAKGMAKGMEKGMVEGERKKALAIAQQLLDILDVPTIAQKTGLSIQEIESLLPKLQRHERDKR
jgi:predicted transposase/invertase (TIGR01784 family)